MSEASTDADRRTRKRRRYSVAWLVLLSAISFILLLVAVSSPGGPRRLSDWIAACLLIFVVSFGLSTGLIFLWFVMRWISRRANLKWMLLAGACLAALVALFYAEEDWRGWRAWSQFKRNWERQGGELSLAGVIPPAVPEDQNFALAPVVYTSYGQILTREGKLIPVEKRDAHLENRMRMDITLNYPGPTNRAGDWARGTFTPLDVWQSYYRGLAGRTDAFPVSARAQSPAADVLLALSQYNGVVEELRAANRLPYSRFPVNYDCESPWGIYLPHLAALKSCAQVLRLRSVAELQNGQPDQTLQDLQLGLQLTEKIRTEPLLISHLVRAAMVQLMLQPIWEGLANHQWSDAQLAALEAELAKLDFASDWRLSMRGELTAFADSVGVLRRHPDRLHELRTLSDFNGRKLLPYLPGPVVARLIPAGWFYQNLQRGARAIQAYCLPVADAGTGTFSPATARRAGVVLAGESSGPYNVYVRCVLPVLADTVQKFACAQAGADLARTALALERCRLAVGSLPESLDALAPQYIARVPHDVISGQALKYRRDLDGRFTLYSVGWNEADDGGVTALKEDGSADIERGDWVWRYP